MTRMTNDLRHIIRKAAVEASFSERNAELARDEAELAVAAYQEVFPPSVLDAVAKVPAEWVRRDTCLNFNVGGLRIRLETGGAGLPVPYATAGSRGYHCHDEIGVIAAGDLCEKIKAHAVAKEAVRDQMKRAHRDLESLLSSISTVNKLKDVWPEGEPFYARFLDAKAPPLPAILFAEVNAILGLQAA